MKPREKRILRWALLFLAPNLIGFLIFTSLPVLFSFGLAFFQWDTFSAPRFIGFDNFIRLLTDPKLWFYLYNTVFLMIGLPLSIGGSLILAIVLSQKLRGIIVYRTVFYLPTVTNGVALFLLWKWLYNPKYGLVNSVLLPVLSWPYFSLAVRVAILLGIGLILKSLAHKAKSERPARVLFALLAASVLYWVIIGPYEFGGFWPWLSGRMPILVGLDSIDDLPNWLSQQRRFGLAVLARPRASRLLGQDGHHLHGHLGVHGRGNMILYLAALANVPEELYEASDIDGASKWQQFWHITWPMIAPTTFFICVMSIIGGLQGGFEIAYLMTNGGPGKDGDNTVTLGYYIYRSAFENLEFGYAAAVAWFMFVIIFTITLFNWRFGRGAVN